MLLVFTVMKRLKELLVPLLLFLLTSAIYIHNLARGIYAGDVGDFATASYVGGIAHAPGYPLFVLLGFLLTRFSFLPSPAFAVGLISAFAGSLCLIFLYFLSFELTKNKFASFLTSIILGFSFLFWFYSEIAEVFVLNAFFIVLLFFLALRLRKYPSAKLLYIFSFFLGLSLTNHQTIIFIFPSLLLLIFTSLKKLFSVKRMLFALFFVLLGFSVYLYPFIATLRHPIINWDPVTNLSSFLHLLLRQDYGTFNAGPFGTPSWLQRFVILKTYGFSTLIQLTVPVITLSVFGVFALWKKNRLACIAFLLAFFISGPVFIFYAGFPPIGNYYDGVLERFLLASQVIIFFFFPVGFTTFIHLLSRASKRPLSVALFYGVFLLLPFQLFFYNFPKTDLSHFYLTEQFAKDILIPLPPHAVLFTTGDTATFNVWYVRYALGIRKDVQLINLGGLSADTAYQRYLHEYLAQHPQKSSTKLSAEILLFIKSQHPVFSFNPVQPPANKKFTWIPEGLPYELLGNNVAVPHESAFISLTQRTWNMLHTPKAQFLHKNVYGSVSAADIPADYVTAMLATGGFFLTKYNDPEEAKMWFDKALAVDPTIANTHAELGIYYIKDNKQCSAAADEFKKSIALDTLQISTYVLLYETYLGCLHDPVDAKRVADNFSNIFQENFSIALNQFFPKPKK